MRQSAQRRLYTVINFRIEMCLIECTSEQEEDASADMNDLSNTFQKQSREDKNMWN
jgi:hypothetical protein